MRSQAVTFGEKCEGMSEGDDADEFSATLLLVGSLDSEDDGGVGSPLNHRIVAFIMTRKKIDSFPGKPFGVLIHKAPYERLQREGG